MKTKEETIYLVQHSYEAKDGSEETKIIGVFATKRSALVAVQSLVDLPGFRRHKKCFYIDAYRMNTALWTEGFKVAKPARTKPRAGRNSFDPPAR